MFSKNLLQSQLQTNFMGCNINYKSRTGSTNDDVWDLFKKGAPQGSLVIADDQTQGRGRHRTEWVSNSGKSLTFSFLLQPDIGLDELGLLPLITGVSIVRGIQESTTIQTGLKWPNDIILNEKKLGGILIESKSNSRGLGVVVGVGINVNETSVDFSRYLRNQAISLSMVSGIQLKREAIVAAILTEFEQLYSEDWKDLIPLWQNYCVHLGREIEFHSHNQLYKGIFRNITNIGCAEIQIEGITETFSAGMVNL